MPYENPPAPLSGLSLAGIRFSEMPDLLLQSFFDILLIQKDTAYLLCVSLPVIFFVLLIIVEQRRSWRSVLSGRQ